MVVFIPGTLPGGGSAGHYREMVCRLARAGRRRAQVERERAAGPRPAVSFHRLLGSIGQWQDAAMVSLRKAAVPGAFDTAAHAYDRLVDANPGYHEHLRLSVQRLGLPSDGEGLWLLDLGCGTGASTAALLAAAPRAEIVAVDASAEMLAQARTKQWPDTVRFVHSRAEELAAAGVTGPFDGVLAAYLVRNLPDPDSGLAALRDLLRPGAPLAVHDYSVADSPRARVTWTAVCWTIIIPAGKLRTGSARLYRYLWRSVQRFDGRAAFVERMRRAGFSEVRSETVPGWQADIVHTFLGRRPT